MNRSQLRVITMNILYQYQLLDSDVDTLFDYNLHYNLPYRFSNTDYDNLPIDELENATDYQFESKEEIKFVINVASNSINRFDEYAKFVDENLNDWSFERLGYLERSILVNAISELDLQIADKKVVIDNAVILAKTYCDDNAYKLINGVLDKR